MQRDLQTLSDTEFDLVVIGGGIFGISTAWDAASRGLRVALVEKDDFAHAASANCFKVVHGGVRYMQHADVVRVRQSSGERNALLRIAPHLVSPLPIAVPTYGHGMKGKEVLGAGLLAYDALTFDRNRGIPDPKQHVPRSRFLSRRETLERYPRIESRGLTGAAILHDGHMHSPQRLALAFLHSAVRAGTVAANYAEATDLLREGDRVAGVRVRDRRSGEAFDLRGRVTVNAAGPWAERLLRENGSPLNPPSTFSRDAFFVVKRPVVDHALAVSASTRDPDAVLSREARHLFLVPWRGVTQAGVWHVVWEGSPDNPPVAEQELQAFIDELNAGYPGAELSLDDVALWNAGLVLFGENRAGQVHLSYGKRSRIVDHRAEGAPGLITLVGVRYTTARSEAEKVVGLVFDQLARAGPASKTDRTPLYGGNFERFDALFEQANSAAPTGFAKPVLEAVLHRHGTAVDALFAHMKSEAGLAAVLGESDVVGAEVVHAIRSEMALTLRDIVMRRTELGTAGHPGALALQQCADIAARELGWSEAERDRELNEVEAGFP